jgi:ferritin-like metal-binding protein YciE
VLFLLMADLSLANAAHETSVPLPGAIRGGRGSNPTLSPKIRLKRRWQQLREDTSYRRFTDMLTRFPGDLAGPHAKPTLTDRIAIPGAEALPEDSDSKDVDRHVAPGFSRNSVAAPPPWPRNPRNWTKLFHDTLKDIFYAEKKILTALPKMAKAAQNPDLKAAFEKHETETEEQVSRLEQVFELLEKKPQGKKCPAIDSIIEEGQDIAREFGSGLLAAAQAVEHYEISRYGTLRAWAQELGLTEAVRLLEATLKEEEKTDQTLSELAQTCVNQEAQEAA